MDSEWDGSQWRAMSGNILPVSLTLCYRVWARAEAGERWECWGTLLAGSGTCLDPG